MRGWGRSGVPWAHEGLQKRQSTFAAGSCCPSRPAADTLHPVSTHAPTSAMEVIKTNKQMDHSHNASHLREIHRAFLAPLILPAEYVSPSPSFLECLHIRGEGRKSRSNAISRTYHSIKELHSPCEGCNSWAHTICSLHKSV
jgi:hypothetical protein